MSALNTLTLSPYTATPGSVFGQFAEEIAVSAPKPDAKMGPVIAEEKSGRQTFGGIAIGADGFGGVSFNAANWGDCVGGGHSWGGSEFGATRRYGSSYRDYRLMRNDPVVAIAREVADILVKTNQWTYEKADPDDAEHEDLLELIKETWEGRGGNGQSHQGVTLREDFVAAFCRAKDYGNFNVENVWGVDGKGRTTVVEFAQLLSERTRPLLYEGTRKLAAIRNYGIKGGQVDLYHPYFTRFIYDSEAGDLFGRSRFENGRKWIQLKHTLAEKIEVDMNVSLGNVVTIGYPADADPKKNAANEQTAGRMVINIRRGVGVTVPGYSADAQTRMIQAGIDPSKVTPYPIDKIETDNSFEDIKIATGLFDEQIMFSLLVLPRSIREAEHGSKADAEQHTDSMSTIAWNEINRVVGMANNITDDILEQAGGKEARGTIRAIPHLIDDESIAIIKEIMTTILSANPDLALKIIDVQALLEKLKIKTLPEFDQAKLAVQTAAKGLGDKLSNSEHLRNAGYDDKNVERIRKEQAEQDAVPVDEDGLGKPPKNGPATKTMSGDEDAGGGHWVTIGGGGEDDEGGGGAHIFIKDGAIAKGPKGLVGKKMSELSDKHKDSMRDARRTHQPSHEEAAKGATAEEKKSSKQTARKYSASGVHRELVKWHADTYGGGVDDYLGEAGEGSTAIDKETAREHVRGGGSINVHKHVKGGRGEDFHSDLIQEHGTERGERLYQDYANNRLKGEGGKVDEAIAAAKSEPHANPRMAYLAHHVENMTGDPALTEEVNAKNFLPGDKFTSHGEEFEVKSHSGIPVLHGAGMEMPYADSMGKLPIDKGSYKMGDPFDFGDEKPKKTSGQQKGLLGERFDGPTAGSRSGNMFGDTTKGPASALEAKGNEVGQAVKDKETGEMFQTKTKSKKGRKRA